MQQPITPVFFDAVLRDVLGEPPRVQGAEAVLEFIPRWDHPDQGAWDGERGELRHAVRLVTWDLEGDELTIRDVKEQEVSLIRAEYRAEGARLAAALEGWARAVEPLLNSARRVDRLMPSDLVSLDVLALARPHTPDQFAEAYTAKSRLGRWL